MDLSTLASCLPPLVYGRARPPAMGQEHLDLLILGAGWTATFLIPHIKKNHPKLTYASTTRAGGGDFGSIPFTFDPLKDQNEAEWKKLPDATTVLVTFPIKDAGGSKRLVEGYARTRRGDVKAFRVIQLGSTGIFNGDPTLTGDDKKPKTIFFDRHSPWDQSNARGQSEAELLSLSSTQVSSLTVYTTVLNLSGLYGGARSMRNYVGRVAPTKEALSNKGSIHMVHGLDVARGIIGTHEHFDKMAGQRWIVSDMRCYDWWDLASAWGDGGQDSAGDEETKGPQAKWVEELMREQDVRALPRPFEMLGRVMDAREFWGAVGLSPVRARLERQ